MVIAGGKEAFRATRYVVTEAALYPSYKGGMMFDELAALLRGLGFEMLWAFNVGADSCDVFWKNNKLVDG